MVLRAAAFAIVCILWIAPSLGAAPIPVQFTEGVSRGFLTLRSQDGGKLADGDILQTLKGEVVESRLVFHFVDGSLYDETVAFSQHRVFTLQRYHLVQRGPSFSIRLEISFDRETGQYKGWYADEEGGEKTLGGTIEMPPDLYNGMIAMLLRNLPRGASETVQMVTFTPKPRLVKLHLSPLGGTNACRGCLKIGDPLSGCSGNHRVSWLLRFPYRSEAADASFLDHARGDPGPLGVRRAALLRWSRLASWIELSNRSTKGGFPEEVDASETCRERKRTLHGLGETIPSFLVFCRLRLFLQFSRDRPPLSPHAFSVSRNPSIRT